MTKRKRVKLRWEKLYEFNAKGFAPDDTEVAYVGRGGGAMSRDGSYEQYGWYRVNISGNRCFESQAKGVPAARKAAEDLYNYILENGEPDWNGLSGRVVRYASLTGSSWG